MAAIFVGVAAGVFLLLGLLAALIMLTARRLPRSRSPVVQLAIANMYRPGAVTPSVVLSLGLGLALLVTVIAIEGNLRRQFLAALPDKAPAFYYRHPSADAERFDAFVHAHAPRATLERVPMLRGRIVATNGVPAETLKPAPDAAWALQSDRGVTYSDEVPAGSRVVEGQWWTPDYRGPPLVSFEKRIADGLGLKLGEQVIVNVLGRNLTATVANLRGRLAELGIRFVMVLPSTFRGAPHTHIATLTCPGGGSTRNGGTGLRCSRRWPTTSGGHHRRRAALSAPSAASCRSTPPSRREHAHLARRRAGRAALAAGHRHRVYDAVILKTVGATRLGSFHLRAEYLRSASPPPCSGWRPARPWPRWS
jgi:putative ABC transport system permease protein